jgi:hypothetical protein
MNLMSTRVARRTVVRSLAAAAVLSTTLIAPFSRVSAQQEIDPAFSSAYPSWISNARSMS